MIWAVAAIMALSVAVGLLWPLGSKASVRSGRVSKTMAIYEDQLSEVERDQERGLITASEAQAAQVEIKRRMLGAGEDEAPVAERSGKGGIIASALFVPVAAFALYTQIGAPNVPTVPFAERADEQRDAAQLQTLLGELKSRLESDPEGGETRGWTLLATTLMNQNRYSEAADAFSKLIDRDDATSATFSQYAEALILAENGTVTPLAGRIIAKSAELDPTNPAATYYSAIEQDQAGNSAQARALLLDRIAEEGQPAPWMPTFLTLANNIGTQLGEEPVTLPEFETPSGPKQDDIEAASEMSEEDREAFIRTMVDGLEERLQDEPENLDGWLQLARSLMVLGEQDRALAALKSAQPLVSNLPADDPRRLTVETGLAQLGFD